VALELVAFVVDKSATMSAAVLVAVLELVVSPIGVVVAPVVVVSVVEVEVPKTVPAVVVALSEIDVDESAAEEEPEVSLVEVAAAG
jgi:hypothetical protein